jgi:hypothetical protein
MSKPLAAGLLVLLAALARSGPAAPTPKEGRFDFTLCFAGKMEHMAVDKEVGGGSYDLGVAVYANGDSKMFDRTGARCLGAYVTRDGRFEDAGYCVLVDADGDKWLMKYATAIGPDSFRGTWDAVHGTGKYAGMTATGEYKTLGPIPAVQSGGLQGCNRNSGTYKLR